MTDDELYEITAGWWGLARHKGPRAEYAATVSKGVIRAVYRIERWRERVPGDRDWQSDIGKEARLGFYGFPAADLKHLLNRSVRHLFKPGPSDPLTYLNCAAERTPLPILRGAEARRAAAEEGVHVLAVGDGVD